MQIEKLACTNVRNGVTCGREEDADIHEIDFATGSYLCSVCRRGEFLPISSLEKERLLRTIWSN